MSTQRRIHTHDLVPGRDFPVTLADGTVLHSADEYSLWRRGTMANQDAAINRALGASDGGNATPAAIETLDGIPDERKPGRKAIDGQVAETFGDKPIETLDGETDHTNGTTKE